MARSSKSIRDDSPIHFAKAEKTQSDDAHLRSSLPIDPIFIHQLPDLNYSLVVYFVPGFIVLPRIILPREIGPRQRI